MFNIRLSEFSNCQSSESSWRRSPVTSNRQNPVGTGARQHLIAKILPAPEFDDIRPSSPDASGLDFGRNWLEYCRISAMVRRPDPATNPAGSSQNGRDSAESGQDSAGYDRIRPLIRSDPKESGQNLAKQLARRILLYTILIKRSIRGSLHGDNFRLTVNTN
jgi:hypothetical protein